MHVRAARTPPALLAAGSWPPDASHPDPYMYPRAGLQLGEVRGRGAQE